MLSVGTRNAAGRRACHAQARSLVLGVRRRAWQGQGPVTFRMRSGATVPQARCNPPLAALENLAGLPSPHVPADILSAGLPVAHRPTETHNGFRQGEGVRGRGLAWKASPMRSRSYSFGGKKFKSCGRQRSTTYSLEGRLWMAGEICKARRRTDDVN